MSEQMMAQRPKFSVAINTEKYKRLINNTLGDPERARRFVAAITSAVAVNPGLQECDAGSVLSAALLGESLNLSPSPQLGQYYLVPYNNKRTNVKQAQFQLGYKGYIQLAVRSGQYKRIVVSSVKEGELEYWDPINEEISFSPILDEAAREAAATVGYYAMFEYMNGFRKSLYWSKEKMERHARTYSRAYSSGKSDSFWVMDFDAMAYKTMLRQLISKWGIMSIEMSTAAASDGNLCGMGPDGAPEYLEAESHQGQAAETSSAAQPTQPPQETQAVSMDEL